MKCPVCESINNIMVNPQLAPNYSFITAEFKCRNCFTEGEAYYKLEEVEIFNDEESTTKN